MLMLTIGKKQGKTNEYIKWKTTGVYNKKKPNSFKRRINPLDDNKKLITFLRITNVRNVVLAKIKQK